MKLTIEIDDNDQEKLLETAKFLDQRIPEVEARLIQTSAVWCIWRYARDVVKGRWPEAEPLILKQPDSSYYYALEVVKGRWPKAEALLRKDGGFWNRYLLLINRSKYTQDHYLNWLEDEGVTQEILDIFNYNGTLKAVQERVIQLRPDLIGKIRGLRPSLKAKYQHELELVGVDV